MRASRGGVQTVRLKRRIELVPQHQAPVGVTGAVARLGDPATVAVHCFCNAKGRYWPEIEVRRRPRFGRDRVKSGRNSDIAEVKRLTHRVIRLK
jgi:hypothetical protein